jgi:hypothetical protein
MRTVLAIVVLVLVGCGAQTPRPVAASANASPEPRTPREDALTNHRLTREWSCAALRRASEPVSIQYPYLFLTRVINRAAGRTCDRVLSRLRKGVTRSDVEAWLGRPDRASRCWLYRWPPDAGSSTDGVRLCFDRGRVSKVQIAVHL